MTMPDFPSTMTNQGRILAVLQQTTDGLTDAQVREKTGISPHQTVNRICNELAKAGVVSRVKGSDGVWVNRLADGVSIDSMRRSSDRAGSSTEQRDAERIMVELLAERLGVRLAPRRLDHASGARVEVDAAAGDLSVLAECWAHQGPAKVAQKYKLVNDATKLHWVGSWLQPSPSRLLLCVSDEQAVRHLRGRSWQGRAIADMGVEIVVVSLPQSVVDEILDAQKRQYR